MSLISCVFLVDAHPLFGSVRPRSTPLASMMECTAGHASSAGLAGIMDTVTFITHASISFQVLGFEMITATNCPPKNPLI